MSRILIVEDDEFLAGAYQTFLSKAGYEVVQAFDGEEGLEKIRKEPFDLVLLDIAMPKKSGLDVLGDLQKNPSTKTPPIIVASNFDDQETVKKCLDLGAQEYFVKSNISISKVGEICQRYLEKK
jgi:DNA-binding response OmpR family regulator